jgi:hypothetical protein
MIALAIYLSSSRFLHGAAFLAGYVTATEMNHPAPRSATVWGSGGGRPHAPPRYDRLKAASGLNPWDGIVGTGGRTGLIPILPKQ